MATHNQFHLHLECKTRSKGQSAAAIIAYICATAVRDIWFDKNHDYTRRKGVLKYACFNFQGSVVDLAALMDGSEKRVNSCVCRSLDIALPRGLKLEERWRLVKEIAETIAKLWNVPVVAALHAPSREGDRRNHHAHFVFASRVIVDGCLKSKTRMLDSLKTGPEEVTHLRSEISRSIVSMLRLVGRGREAGWWDHRSFETRGIAKKPGEHLGPRRTRHRRLLEAELRKANDLEIDQMISDAERREQDEMLRRIECGLTSPHGRKLPPSGDSPAVGVSGF